MWDYFITFKYIKFLKYAISLNMIIFKKVTDIYIFNFEVINQPFQKLGKKLKRGN